MTFSSRSIAFILSAALAAITGCASAPGDDATTGDDAEEALSAAGKKLVGVYSAESGVRPPTFQHLRLGATGDFEATVDSGIRCVVAPCPTYTSFYGTYTAGTKYLTLKAAQGVDDGGYAGRYRYTVGSDGTVTITRSGSTWNGWSNDLKPAPGILPSDATKLVADSPGGGFMPHPPTGSNCAGQQHYELVLATRAFTYSYCQYDANGPWLTKSGSKTLTKAQAARVRDAFDHATIATADTCGADKPFQTVSVTTPSGTKKYLDSFYSCQGQGTYIDGIGEIFSAMGDLAH